MANEVQLRGGGIAIIALVTVAIGFMTGLAIGHYKNIRLDMMISDLEKIMTQVKTSNVTHTDLKVTLANLERDFNTTRHKNAIETGCTRQFYKPYPVSSAIDNSSQVLILDNIINFKVVAQSEMFPAYQNLIFPGTTGEIHSRDIALLPMYAGETPDVFESCWIALATSQPKPTAPADKVYTEAQVNEKLKK